MCHLLMYSHFVLGFKEKFIARYKYITPIDSTGRIE